MAKKEKDKQLSTKHTHKTKDRAAQTKLKTQVLWKGKQFLLHLNHATMVVS
jgi:hypothetical protein